MNSKKFFILLSIFIPASILTCVFHEFGHWLTGEILGNEMIFGLNHVSAKHGYYLATHHEWIIAFAGPLFTLIQAITLWLVIEYFHYLFAFPFLYFTLFIRLAALLSGNLSMQDEAIIAQALGTNTFAFFLPLLIILLLLVYRSHRILTLKWYHQVIFSGMSFICILGIILADEFLL